MKRGRYMQLSKTFNSFDVQRVMWHFGISQIDAYIMLQVHLFLALNTPTDDEPRGKVRQAVVSLLEELEAATGSNWLTAPPVAPGRMSQ